MKEKLERFKKWSKGFLMRAKYMLPSILISFFILITTSIFFGRNNAVLGILLLFFNLMSMANTFSITSYFKSSVIFLIIGVVSAFAGLNMYTTVILDFIVPFLLIMLFSDELSPKGYFIYGMFFVLLQSIFPTSLDIIPSRMAAMIYGLAVLLIFNLIQNKRNKRNAYGDLLKEGFTTVSTRLTLLATDSLTPETPNTLSNVTEKISTKLYGDAFQKTGLLNGKEECYFQSMLFLEEVDKEITEAYTKGDITEEEKVFYQGFSEILSKLGKEYKYRENESIIEQVKEFARNANMANEDWKYLLEKLKYILIKFNQKEEKETTTKDVIRLKIIKLKRSFNLKSSHLRFALRVSIVICLGFTIAHLIPFANAYWLPITAFTVMLPFYEDEKAKLSSNFIGAILGAICFILVFQYMPTAALIVFMLLAFVILFSINNYVLQTIIGTQLALVSCSATVGSPMEALDMRLLIVVIAILITWLTDRFILHTDRYDGLLNRIDDMLYKDRMILIELRKSIMGNTNSRYLDELLLESYLIRNEIEQHAKNSNKVENLEQIYALLDYNKNFVLEAEKLINIFNYQRLDYKDMMLMSSTLSDMEVMLNSLQHIDSNIGMPNKKPKVSLYESEYIKNSMLSCKNNIAQIYKSVNEKSLQ